MITETALALFLLSWTLAVVGWGDPTLRAGVKQWFDKIFRRHRETIRKPDDK